MQQMIIPARHSADSISAHYNPFKPPIHHQTQKTVISNLSNQTGSNCLSNLTTTNETQSINQYKSQFYLVNSIHNEAYSSFSSGSCIGLEESKKENNSLAGNQQNGKIIKEDVVSRNSPFSQKSMKQECCFSSLSTNPPLISCKPGDRTVQTASLMPLLKYKSTGANTSTNAQVSTSSCSNRSSSNNNGGFKGDRFIPFRGTSDSFYLEEFILNNEDPFKEQRRKRVNHGNQRPATSQNNNGPINEETIHSMTPSLQEEVRQQTDRVQNIESSGGSSIQYSQGSGDKKKQSFQELITESLFTQKRGSPSTLTLQEAEEEELRFSRLPEGKKRISADNQENLGSDGQKQQRILSFKEKRSRPSMSLHKNLSLIQTLAQEKTQKQQKTIRCIPQFPEKILDAPDLVDDYYLNLLDWSSSNVLAVCLAQTVYLWNAETGDIKQVFDTENDNDIVTSVAWMKGSSPVLAIGTSSKQIHLWDTTQFSKIKTYENHHDGRVSSMAWNPTYHYLLSSGSIDSLIHSVDIRAPPAQSIICTYQSHRQEVCGLKWSPDGQQLASGGNDNFLCIWDINARMRGGFTHTHGATSNLITQPRFMFQDHKAAVKAISWCPWQRYLLASGGGSRDQTIKFWNTDSGTLIQSVQTESQVCSLQWNPFEREILSSHGFVNNQLCIWKYPQMKKIADLRGHTSRVLHLALNPEGTTLASAAADETLRFWKVFQPSSKKLLVSHQNHPKVAPNMDEDCADQARSTEDIIMQDCSKFIQASPSQFNGFSLR